jgi:hypothetical protein
VNAVERVKLVLKHNGPITKRRLAYLAEVSDNLVRQMIKDGTLTIIGRERPPMVGNSPVSATTTRKGMAIVGLGK